MTNARQAGGVGLRGPGNLKEYPDNNGLVGGQEGGPLVLFDEGRALSDVLVLSPMGSWFASVLGMRPLLHHSGAFSGNALVAGVQGDVTNVPAGHTASFLLCATLGKGINAGVQRWGSVLRSKYAVPKLGSTVVEQKLGYWTDVSDSPPRTAFVGTSLCCCAECALPWPDGLCDYAILRCRMEVITTGQSNSRPRRHRFFSQTFLPSGCRLLMCNWTLGHGRATLKAQRRSCQVDTCFGEVQDSLSRGPQSRPFSRPMAFWACRKRVV